MKILEPILFIFLYLIIGAYGLVALHLIAQGILDLRKESVTDKVRFGHPTNRELFQTGSRLSASADGQHMAAREYWNQRATGKNANHERSWLGS